MSRDERVEYGNILIHSAEPKKSESNNKTKNVEIKNWNKFLSVDPPLSSFAFHLLRNASCNNNFV